MGTFMRQNMRGFTVLLVKSTRYPLKIVPFVPSRSPSNSPKRDLSYPFISSEKPSFFFNFRPFFHVFFLFQLLFVIPFNFFLTILKKAPNSLVSPQFSGRKGASRRARMPHSQETLPNPKGKKLLFRPL